MKFTAKIGAATLGLLMLGASMATAQDSPRTIAMGTAGPGTVVYTWINTIANMLTQDKAPVQIKVVSDVWDNEAMRILNSGGAGIDASFVTGSSLIGAMLGRPPWKEPATNLRAAFPLGQAPAVFVVRGDSGITGLSQLDGKRVTAGPSGIGTDVFMRGFLKKTLPDADITFVAVPVSGFASALQDRKVDAIFVVGWPPYPVVEEAASLMDISYLKMSEEQMNTWLSENPQHHKMVLEAGINPQQDEDITAIGHVSHLIVPTNIDEQAIYDLTKYWLDSDVRNRLLEVTPSLESSFAAMSSGVYFQDVESQRLKLHPGAAKAMREAGIDIPANLLE